MHYDVSVIGLGRVGLPLALCFADAGLRVLGVDKNAERLEALRRFKQVQVAWQAAFGEDVGFDLAGLRRGDARASA